MIKNFVFCVGLPGCGKSTYISEYYKDCYSFSKHMVNNDSLCDELDMILGNYYSMSTIKDFITKQTVMISADEIKPCIPSYSDEHPEFVHEESVKQARSFLFELFNHQNDDGSILETVIMDGGGINRHYTENILKKVREYNSDIYITELFFDTPIEVCLKRIESRDRKVPVEAIYEKNQMIANCINRYKPLIDEFIRVDYYTNRYIILDMDGTVAGYTKARFDMDGNADFVNGGLFRYLRPNTPLIDFVKKNYDMDNVYICTACANSIAWQEKCEWLDRYFPEIPVNNRYWCGNKDYKHVFIKQLAEHMEWKLNEVTLIDDYHPTIAKCKEYTINCIHPSNIGILVDKYAIFS